MIHYISGYSQYNELHKDSINKANFLISYIYYIKRCDYIIANSKRIMIDSGVFTILNQSKNLDFEDYLKKYSNFCANLRSDAAIIELDLYSLVGIAKTEQYRDMIEQRIGRQCLPVWHPFLGIEYLDKLFSLYNYITIGGYAINSIPKKEYLKIMPQIINRGRKNNCKIHALGYFGDLDFYSSDSTDFVCYCKFNRNYKFGTKFGKFEKQPTQNVIRFRNLPNYIDFLETLNFL